MLRNGNFSHLLRYGFAVFAVILAAWLREFLDPAIGQGLPFIIFYPAVVLAAWFGGLGPGLCATVLAELIAWYMFIPVLYSFRILDRTALAQMIIFLLGGVLISLLAEGLHRARRKAQAEETIERGRHEQFRVTLNSIGDAVIATDVQGKVTFMNRVAETLTGWSYETASGRALNEIFKVVNEETRQAVENPALRALEQGVLVGLANHSILIAKDGTERPIDDSAAPIRSPEGVTTGSVLVFRDITQRRAAEREIWQSRERLRITLSSIGDAVVTTDGDGRVTYANPIAEKLLGYSLEQAEGRPLGEVFKIANEFTRQVVENPVERVLSDGHIVGLANHTILIRPDGAEVPIDDSAAPIRDDADRTVGAVLIFRDITERRRAQKAQATLAAIVDSSEDAIVSKDLEGRIMTWNAGAERLFGYSAEEAIGRSITLIIPPDRLDEEPAILQRIRNGERVEHFETVRAHKDGRQLDISLTISPVRDPDGEVVGASKIARDITERKKIEEQLREADRQKDNFLAILAHELRNPLGPIRNAVKILEMERPHDVDLLFYTDLVDKEVIHITRLLNDLLDVSRITTGKLTLQKERINIASVLNDALRTSQAMIDEAGHKLTVNIPPEPLMVEADPMRLTQVFANLLNNAAKFTDSAGDIRLSAERRDGRAVIRIRDSGIGIAEHLLAKIFDMFVQGVNVIERTYGGLGLGLTLAREIVEFHGGTIEATSSGPGKGSEFIVSLPLAQSVSPASSESHPGETLPKTSRQVRIVVVDDNKQQASSLQHLLQTMGHEAQVAYDGPGAMKLMSTFVPDIALVDLGLPGMDGYEVARRLRERHEFRNVVFIAQTGWGREEDRKRAREAGFEHHLVKPIDHHQLAQILADLEEEKGS
ncbi:MAG TPA: PAS domain S-box protein [Candidatus Binatia bacterium]